MSQSEISNTIKECLNIFGNHFCRKWIRFPKTIDKENCVKRNFYEKFGFTGIIGVVDGTYVKIKSPNEEQKHLYYNRKGYYSLNVMLICDQYIKHEFNRGKLNTWVIGDSGYPLLPYLMTPFRSICNTQEERYNTVFCKCRNIIERCNGVLKARFRCIIGDRGLLYSPKKATQIVNVYCGIHNACIFYKHDTFVMEEEEIDNNAAAEIRRRIAHNLS